MQCPLGLPVSQFLPHFSLKLLISDLSRDFLSCCASTLTLVFTRSHLLNNITVKFSGVFSYIHDLNGETHKMKTPYLRQENVTPTNYNFNLPNTLEKHLLLSHSVGIFWFVVGTEPEHTKMSNREALFIQDMEPISPEAHFVWFQMCGDEKQAGLCVCVTRTTGKNTIYTMRESFCSWPQWRASAWYTPQCWMKTKSSLGFNCFPAKSQWFNKSLNFKWMHFHLKYLFYTYTDRYTHIYTHIYIFRLGHLSLLHPSSCRPCK